VDFVAGVGFRFFACGFRLIGGGFRGFRLLARPILMTQCKLCTRAVAAAAVAVDKERSPMGSM